MKAIAISAPQSRNLTNNLFREVTKMIKKQLYRTNRMHVALRAWSRLTVNKFGNTLLAIAAVSAFCFFATMAADQHTIAVISLFATFAAMTPEIIKMSYVKTEED